MAGTLDTVKFHAFQHDSIEDYTTVTVRKKKVKNCQGKFREGKTEESKRKRKKNYCFLYSNSGEEKLNQHVGKSGLLKITRE